MPDDTTTRVRHRGRTSLAWLVANLVLGYLASFPLLTAVVFSYYVRAKLWGTVSSPYRDGEADVPLYLIAGTGIPLAVAAVLVNRALRRRMGLEGWRARVFWAVSMIVLFAPFAFFVLNPKASTYLM